MHIVEREIREKYRYSNLSYVFDVYMECEYRANLTPEEFDGLLPGEFRFDYESWGRRLGFSKKQLVRAIKELTINNAVIVQTFKGRKGLSSKYFLTRFKEQKGNSKGTETTFENTGFKDDRGTEKGTKTFEEQKKDRNEEQKGNSKGTEINLENTRVEEVRGTEKGTKKEQNEEQKKVHSSRYNNLDIISNNKYSDIFDFWISKNIKKHRALTSEMKKAIDKALKEYSKDEILESINNYGDMYNDLNYQWCNYQWGLNEFLVRKDKDGIRQIGLFLNDGSKYLNYLKTKEMKERRAEKKLIDLY